MQRRIVSKTLESEKIEVPLAIQTYLWGQTRFFLKPSLNEKRSYGAACTAFEKIICENRVCDLPPNLSSPMTTIPRWHFVQGAFPFVLHCCEALLYNRIQTGTGELSSSESKLLYTMHWILLKAPDEVDNYSEQLHPLSTVELFVQSIVPYGSCIQTEDLTSELKEGLDIWKALWQYKAPPVKSFTSSVILGGDKAQGAKTSIGGSIRRHSSATFFDLAVLKCLMLSDWHEEGRFWGMQYILKFLENEIAEQAWEEANPSEDTEESDTAPTLGVANVGHSQSKVDKLKRFYGFTGQPGGNPHDKRRLSLKDSFRRIAKVNTTSSSSLLDPALATKPLDLEENCIEIANGAKQFLDENGCVKKKVFLDVVFHIASQSSAARVFDVALSVLILILDNHVIKTTVSMPVKDSTVTTSMDKEHMDTLSVTSRDKGTERKQMGRLFSTAKLAFYSTFNKALICVIKIFCSLGCSYGCGKGIRGAAGKSLRGKAMAMLTKLHTTEAGAFKTCLTKYFENEDVEHVTDFLHALLGFCTMTLESKNTQKIGNLFKEKRDTLGFIIDYVFGVYIAKISEFNLEEISNVVCTSLRVSAKTIRIR